MNLHPLKILDAPQTAPVSQEREIPVDLLLDFDTLPIPDEIKYKQQVQPRLVPRPARPPIPGN